MFYYIILYYVLLYYTVFYYSISVYVYLYICILHQSAPAFIHLQRDEDLVVSDGLCGHIPGAGAKAANRPHNCSATNPSTNWGHRPYPIKIPVRYMDFVQEEGHRKRSNHER